MRLPRRREKKDDDVVVIGQELADATDREEQHRRAMGDVNSPLARVTYDGARGEFDLHRFVPTHTDDEIRAFLARYTPDMQAALTQGDFYTLLAFARRMALAVLRGADPARLDEARAAIRAVDVERVDWRDVSVASALVDDPDSSGYVRIETPDGPGFLLSPGTSETSGDLTKAAFALQAVLEQDVYRVAVSGGDDVPSVWFSEPVDQELRGLRATMALSGHLDSAASEEADNQQLTVFLAEAATEADAARLAEAAVPSDWFEALGVAAGRICAVMVARSWVDGVAAYEQPGALERFREPFAAALRAPSGG